MASKLGRRDEGVSVAPTSLPRAARDSPLKPPERSFCSAHSLDSFRGAKPSAQPDEDLVYRAAD